MLFRKVAGLVPFLAEFAATPNVGHHIKAAAIKPNPAREIKIGRHADAITAIAIKKRRVLSVLLGPFFTNDIEWNLRSIF